jgi:hypothetical protein
MSSNFASRLKVQNRKDKEIKRREELKHHVSTLKHNVLRDENIMFHTSFENRLLYFTLNL